MPALIPLLLAPAFAQDGGGYISGGGSSSATPDYYVIQTGDTLWDISTRFLGDPYQWPQLWSYNDYITNPHWIYPGNKIYFHLGDELTPPQVVLIEEDNNDGYQPPPEPEPVAEQTCDLPKRFNTRTRDVTMTVGGLIGEAEDLNLRGRVLGTDRTGVELGQRAILYLVMEDASDIACGKLLGIFRKEQSSVRGSSGYLGQVWRVLGTARVLRVDDEVVTVEVRDALAEIERGDVVGDVFPTRVRMDVKAPSGDVDGRVVARLNKAQLTPEREVLFLDRGTNDGLDVGNALYVVEQHDGSDILDEHHDRRLPEYVIGRVVVVRADADRATAVLVDAWRELPPAARVVGELRASTD
jgi:hypothetical protein